MTEEAAGQFSPGPPPLSMPPPLPESAVHGDFPPRPQSSGLEAPATMDAPAPRSGLLRRIFRPAVVWTLGALVVVAGNAWMYHVIDGWRAEDAALRHRATVAGNSVGESNASLAGGAELLGLLKSQSDATSARAAKVEADGAAQ
ncbi:MAG TPA: hypothetical protein VF362_02430, partial [Demequinaceae bacterium]